MSGRPLVLSVRALRTHAEVWGEGPPLVVVPGLGCASWMYRRLAAALAPARTVYLYDPPGHGRSEGRPGEPTRIEALTEHLAAWIEATGLPPVPVFGHSLGGEVGFELAARYAPLLSALIACAPTGVPENPSLREQLWRLARDVPRERPGLLWPGLRAYARCGGGRMFTLARDQVGHETGPYLPQIAVPTLLIDGQSDPVVQSWTVEAIRESVPDAVVVQIHGGTHAVTDSHPRAVARYVLDFLQAQEV